MGTFELRLLDAIQTHLRTGWLDALAIPVTALSDHGLIWILTGIVLLCIPRTRRLGFCALAALAVMEIVGNQVVKRIVDRARPCDVSTAVQLLIARPRGSSFPSGHTASSFAVVFALVFAHSRLWKAALPVAILVALSRLYLYVHYPTDVLGGVLLGVLCGWAGVKIVSLAYGRRGKKAVA